MNCVNHKDRIGINMCSECGSWLCSQCSIEIDGHILCKRCISRLTTSIKPISASAPPPPPPMPSRAPAPPPRIDIPIHASAPVSGGGRRNRPNRFLLLIFSALPGANYMYLGLMKRGLFVLSSFFLSFYLMTSLEAYSYYGSGIPVFAAVAGIIAIASFFDGFNIRRKMVEGENVPDDISNIVGFLNKYKGYLIAFAVLAVGLQVIREMGYYLNSSGNQKLGVLIVLIVIFRIFSIGIDSSEKKKRKSKKEDVIDLKKNDL